jgi:hypothetical protein
MKKITFSADEILIERARMVARSQHKTLNSAFREWLVEFTKPIRGAQKYTALMKRLKGVRAKGPYTRDEMNER